MSRAEEYEALAAGLERILSLRFPTHDNYNTGRADWTTARDKAVQALLDEMATKADSTRTVAETRLRMALGDCISQAGHPDPCQGCRLVIATAKAALRLS